MPPVRTLSKPEAKQPEQQPQSTAVALPSWANTNVAALPQISNGPAAVYVGQLQPSTGKRQTLMQQGVQDGGYYLDNVGAVTPLSPFRFWLLEAEAFKTEMNAAGEIVAATRDLDTRAKGLEEHAVALILVDTPNGIVPAKCDFRKAQSPAYSEAVKGIAAAMEPDFVKISDAAKVAAQFPAPWGRVVTTVSVERRISKSSGKPYFLSSGVTQPASVSDLQKLAAFLQDPDANAAVEKARESFTCRVNQIAKLCKD